LIKGVKGIGEWGYVTLAHTSCADLADQIAISVIATWAGGHTIVIVEIGSHAFGAVAGSKGAGGTDGGTSTACNLIAH
jgi:hypothetical protein